MLASNSQSGANIPHNTHRFAKFYSQMQKIDNLYLIVGPKKAGKSLVIDLLTEKTLVLTQDQMKINNILVSASNNKCEYDPIYFQTFQEQGCKSMFLQGFTLSAESERQAINQVKGVFLREGIKNCKNLSIIVVVEQGQMETLAQISEHLLTCLNLYDKNRSEIVKDLLNNIYLLFTKTQSQGSAIQTFSRIHDELIDQSRHQGTKNIVQELNKKNKHKQFLTAKPHPTFPQQIKQLFKPMPIANEIKAFFAKQQNGQQIVISEKQQVDTIGTVHLTILYIHRLIQMLFSYQKQQDYQTFLRSSFQGDFRTLSPDRMKNPLWRGRTIAQKVVSISQLPNNKKTFTKILQILLSITQSMMQTAEQKESYLQINGMVEFLMYIRPWVREDTCLLRVEEVKMALKQCLDLMSTQKQSQPTVTKKSVVIEKKGLAKKQTPFSIFKSSLQKFTSNEQVLQYCIGLIKQKQRSDGYEWSDGILPLRLLRDLLRQYDTSNQTEYIFVEEILYLYLYNDSYYEFEKLLNKYICERALSVEVAKKLMIQLLQLKRFDSSVKVINYLIANTIDDEQFLVLNQLKRRSIQKAHKVFMERSQTKEASSLIRKQQLTLSFQELKGKSKDKAFLNFMKSCSFQHYLQGHA